MIPLASLIAALGALAIAGWTVVSGGLRADGLDGLFLIAVSLFIAAAFLFVPFHAWRQGEFGAWTLRRKKESVGPAGQSRESASQENAT